MCTWLSCQSSLQSRTSCSHFGGPTLSQWPHSELEGAPRHVDAPVPHAHTVHAHLCWHKAHAVGVVPHSNQLSRLTGSRGGGDLSCDVLQVYRCRQTGYYAFLLCVFIHITDSLVMFFIIKLLIK